MQVVENDLQNVKNAASQPELDQKFRLFRGNTCDLVNQVCRRLTRIRSNGKIAVS